VGLKNLAQIHEFDLLFKVAEAFMTIPHSNAGLFLDNKIKTPTRSLLKLDSCKNPH